MLRKLKLIELATLFFFSSHGIVNASETDLNYQLNTQSSMIEELKKRLVKMEAENEVQTQQRDENILAMQKNATHARGSEAGIPLHGFTDVGYGKSSTNYGDQRANGFSIGSLDLYMAPQFGDRVRALVETVVERDVEGKSGIDLERVQLGYAFSDAVILWGGRFHTPYGYWNAAFHHGAQIQTSLLRPKFIDFEDKGGILPAHTVGLWGAGKVGLWSGHLGYDVYAGNGSRITSSNILDMNNDRDDNDNMAIGGNLAYHFSGNVDGLILGIHALFEEVDAYDAVPVVTSRTSLNIMGVYGYYANNDCEILSEYYHFMNSDLVNGTGAHNSWAAFLQVGQTVVGLYTPYFRIEKADLDQKDNYFAAQTSGKSYMRQVIGLRYELNARSALKFEVNNTDQDSATALIHYNELRTQYSISF